VCALVAAVLVPSHPIWMRRRPPRAPEPSRPSKVGLRPWATWTPAGGLQIVHTDSAEAAGVSALLSRALADSGIIGITDGTGAAPLPTLSAW